MDGHVCNECIIDSITVSMTPTQSILFQDLKASLAVGMMRSDVCKCDGSRHGVAIDDDIIVIDVMMCLLKKALTLESVVLACILVKIGACAFLNTVFRVSPLSTLSTLRTTLQ